MKILLAFWVSLTVLVALLVDDPAILKSWLLLSISVVLLVPPSRSASYADKGTQTEHQDHVIPIQDPRDIWVKKLNEATQRLIRRRLSLEAATTSVTESGSGSETKPRSPSDNGPFDRLPLEITTAILDEVLRDFGPIKVGELDEGRLSIALTCRFWADIFFGNPLWWTAIEVHSRMRYGDDGKLAAVFKRSTDLPLDLVLDGWSFGTPSAKILQGQVSRLKTLTSSCTGSVDRALEGILSSPLPQLKSFKISQNIHQDIQLNTPLLEELKFIGAWEGYNGGTLKFAEGGRPALKILHVERNWDDFIRLLMESSQSVRSFTAVDMGSQRPCPINRIILPALTECHLQGHSSWSTLLMMDATNLETVRFVDWDAENEPILPLRVLPSVRTVEWSGKLELSNFIYNESGDLADLKRILRSVAPAIHKLVLNHNESYRHATTDVIWHTHPNPGLVGVLCSHGLCPELQELHVRGRTWLTVPDIQSIVAARQGTLRSVVVERVGRGEHTSEEIESAMEYLLEELNDIRIPSEDQWVVSADDVQAEG